MSVGGNVLTDVLERTLVDQRRRAMRAMLMRPLLHSNHAAFPLIRQHADWMRDWLTRETGWVLRVETEFARLAKEPRTHTDGTRAARPGTRPADLPLTRRRYALLCLALAGLERGDNQVTLGRIGETVVTAAAEPEQTHTGLHFELRTQDDRRDLVAVVRLLLHLGVLNRVAGSEDAYVRGEHDVLYDVNRRILSTLLVTRRGPSLVQGADPAPMQLSERITAISAQLIADTTEARNQDLRRRLTARLLDDPVVYLADLTADEHAYLMNQRHAITTRIHQATGLIAEIRAEGIAMVDPNGDLSDLPMPAEGTEGHIALLLANHLATIAADADPDNVQPWERLFEAYGRWAQEFGRYWKKAARESGAEPSHCRQAAERLQALGLARITASGVQPLPAVARYSLAEPRIAGKTGDSGASG